MIITSDFIGGNIEVKKIECDTVYLDRELRDNSIDWFYWAFCICGAEGKTITFNFENNRLGYYGPAVSRDLETWEWLNSRIDDTSFRYTFKQNESRLYFAHHMLYHPNRFMTFANQHSIQVSELCKSKKNRSVPYIELGSGNKNIILTSRHHACESTGSYVLEGVLEGLLAQPINNTHIICIPFVDYDGVTDGDQGKGRFPHDHNRDYSLNELPIYNETSAIREYARKNGVFLAFDFHSPWHCGGVNDKVFIVRKSLTKEKKLIKFGQILENSINKYSMQYKTENDFPPNVDWNSVDSPCFGTYMLNNPQNNIAFTLETAYFGEENNVFEPKKAIELGKCFASAISKYNNTSV